MTQIIAYAGRCCDREFRSRSTNIAVILSYLRNSAMKSVFLATTLAILSAASTDAFCAPPTGRIPMSTAVSRSASVSVVMSAESQTRRAVLEQGMATLAGMAGVFALSEPARAGLFGEKKFPGVLDPRAAVRDEEKFRSDEVKKSLEALAKYRSNLGEIGAILKKDPQADVLPKITETFSFGKFRSVLNEVNDTFDEDTQRGTDLIIRNMLQDALELATAAKMKPGVPRSERKEEILQKKLAKLEQAFSNLQAYL